MADQRKYTNKLEGKKVLIIGGSSGIGYGVAEACLECGARVTIASSSPERLATAVDKLKASYPSAADRISFHPCDLGDEETIETNIVKLFKAVGEINHVVYTAGDPVSLTHLHDFTLANMRQVALVRFHGVLLAAREASQYLPKSPESSFTITSGVSAERPYPGMTLHASCAGGHVAMARGLAVDLKPIRVNTVSLGAVDTRLFKMPEEQKQALFKRVVDLTTTGKIAKVEDVVEAYLFCMKDTNVTGSTIASNGGALLT